MSAHRKETTWVLVNHLEDWLILSGPGSRERRFPLSSVIYFDSSTPDRITIHPRGHERMASFTGDPEPCWRFQCDEVTLTRRIIPVPGRAGFAVEYRIDGLSEGNARLEIRPMISGRKSGELHSENKAIRPDAIPGWNHVRFAPYPGIPEIVIGFPGNGSYQPHPAWYRRVRLISAPGDEEALLSPGILTLPCPSLDGVSLWLSAGEAPATTEQALMVMGVLSDSLHESTMLSLIAQLAPHVKEAPLDCRLFWTLTLSSALRRGIDVRDHVPAALHIVDSLLRASARDARAEEDGLLEVTEAGSSWWERNDPAGKVRIGHPIEVESLWLNALASAEIMARVIDDSRGTNVGLDYRGAFLKTSSRLNTMARAAPPDVRRDGTAALLAAALRFQSLSRSQAMTLAESLAEEGTVAHDPGNPTTVPSPLRLFEDRGARYGMLRLLWDAALRHARDETQRVPIGPREHGTLPELVGLVIPQDGLRE